MHRGLSTEGLMSLLLPSDTDMQQDVSGKPVMAKVIILNCLKVLSLKHSG